MTWQEDDLSAHLRGLFEARQLCHQLLHRIAVNGRVSNHSAIAPNENQRMLHSAILQYHAEVGIKASKLNGHWKRDDPVDVVRVPAPESTVEIPPQNWSFLADEPLEDVNLWAQADMVGKEVRLDTLPEEWGAQNEVAVKAVVQGEVKRRESTIVALPPRSARAVMSALDECIERLGWVTEEREIDVHAEPW